MAKRKRESTAAYAASQPLFNALKDACHALERQSTNLTMARDLVQTLHVKLDSLKLDGNLGFDCHERYFECILDAWRIASQTYRRIFEEIKDITAANPAEGKVATESFGIVNTMHGVAMAAEHSVLDVINARAQTRPVPEAAATSLNSAAQVDGKDHVLRRTTREQSTREPAPRPSKRQKTVEVEDTGAKASKDDLGEGFIGSVGTTDDVKKPSRREKRLQKALLEHANQPSTRRSGNRSNVPSRHSTRDTKRGPTGSLPVANGHAGASLGAADAEGPPAKVFYSNGVRYEDVSAEVAARLKAKESKKATEKVEKGKKKRKRRSSTSVQDAVSADAVPPPNNAQMLPERPHSKRAKKDFPETIEHEVNREDDAGHDQENTNNKNKRSSGNAGLDNISTEKVRVEEQPAEAVVTADLVKKKRRRKSKSKDGPEQIPTP